MTACAGNEDLWDQFSETREVLSETSAATQRESVGVVVVFWIVILEVDWELFMTIGVGMLRLGPWVACRIYRTKRCLNLGS